MKPDTPLIQFANLCGMKWNDYVYSGGLSYQSRHDQGKLEQMRSKAIYHAERLVSKINNIK